jgi:hypothetical protein
MGKDGQGRARMDSSETRKHLKMDGKAGCERRCPRLKTPGLERLIGSIPNPGAPEILLVQFKFQS